MAKRGSRILDILTSQGKLEVAQLSAELGVSEVTVRKDLDALQAKGLVQRQHGFATLSNSNDVGGRLAYHHEEKRRLARKAADTRNGMTIVTNSTFIACRNDAAQSLA